MSNRFLKLAAVIGTGLLTVACSTVQENPVYEHSTKYNPAGSSGVTTQAASYQPGDVAQPGTRTITTTPTGSYYNNPSSSTITSSPYIQNGTSYPAGTIIRNGSTVSSASTGVTTSSLPQSQQYAPTYSSGTNYSTGSTSRGYGVGPAVTAPISNSPVTGTRGAGTYIPEDTPAATPYNNQQVYDYGSNYDYGPSYDYEMTPRRSDDYQTQYGQSREVPYDYSPNVTYVEPQRQVQPEYARFGGNYEVRQDDTVYSLSRGLCVEVDEIANMNLLNADYKIYIGQSLKLPPSRC